MFFNELKKKIKFRLRNMRHRLSRHLFREFMLKKRGLEKRANEIEILALGPSHGTRGFNSNLIEKSFNFCSVDQDLYTIHWLFNHYIDSLTNLKKIVFFFCFPAPGHELCKTSSVKNTAMNHYVFGVPYNVTWLGQWRKAAEHRLKKFDDSDIDYTTFSGYIPEEKNETVGNMTAAFRCSHHLRENKRNNLQMHHLFEMYEVCKQKGIKMYMVLAPVRSDYIEELDKTGLSDDYIYRDMFPWAKENKIPVLNCLRSRDFEWSDFDDTDHLNEKGATKLTKKIIPFIQQ